MTALLLAVNVFFMLLSGVTHLVLTSQWLIADPCTQNYLPKEKYPRTDINTAGTNYTYRVKSYIKKKTKMNYTVELRDCELQITYNELTDLLSGILTDILTDSM